MGADLHADTGVDSDSDGLDADEPDGGNMTNTDNSLDHMFG